MKIINKRGDTIIEVVLAMTVLSAVLFTAWGIVNRATQISLAARQRVVMVNQLKEQAEILKNMYRTNTRDVVNIASKTSPAIATVNVSDTTELPTNPCNATKNTATNQVNGRTPLGAFYLTKKTSGMEPERGLKTVADYDNARVWIQHNPQTSSGYIDFYIRACWEVSGKETEDNSQIVVRLNT